MSKATNYKVNRDTFNHDGIEYTHGHVIALHPGRAEQALAVGALVATDEAATEKAMPMDAEAEAHTLAEEAAQIAAQEAEDAAKAVAAKAAAAQDAAAKAPAKKK